MIVLVDFSNLAYLSFFGSLASSGKTLEEIPPSYVGHVGMFQQKLFGIQEALSNLYPYQKQTTMFCLDSYPEEKHSIFPDYKKPRREKAPLPLAPKKAIAKVCHGMTTLQSEGKEADDVMAAFVAKNFDIVDENIVVVSSDKDMWQILDHPNVSILSPASMDVVTGMHLQNHFGLVQWSQVKLYKALWGDSSDNIPNAVPRMKKQLLPIVNRTSGDLEEFYGICKKEKLSKRCNELLEEGKEQVEVNYKLVCLDYNAKIDRGTFGGN